MASSRLQQWHQLDARTCVSNGQQSQVYEISAEEHFRTSDERVKVVIAVFFYALAGVIYIFQIFDSAR